MAPTVFHSKINKSSPLACFIIYGTLVSKMTDNETVLEPHIQLCLSESFKTLSLGKLARIVYEGNNST